MKQFYSFDVETTSLDAYKADLFSMAVCDSDGEASVWRVDGRDGSNPKKSWSNIQDFFFDTSIAKVAHNLKFDYTIIKRMGIEIPEDTVWHDTMMMSRILRNLNPSHELDFLAWELCGWPRDLDSEIKRLGKQLGGYQHIALDKMQEYQIADVQRTMLLHKTFYPEIRSDRALIKDYQNEMQLILTTQRIEEFGIDIDKRECRKLITWLEDELERVRETSYRMFHEHINWSSDTQVIRILFKRLKMPILELTDSRQPSTDKDVILHLMASNPHPVYEIILKHRSYTNGLAYIRSYLQYAGEEGIIRPNINSNEAKTSRQSSSRPNMQNTAKEAALKNPFPVPARRCFKNRQGHIILFVDYAGIEMRLIVDACGEKEMMDAIIVNGDVHAMAAETLYGDLWTERDRCFKYFMTHDAELKKKFRKMIEELGREPASAELFKKLRKILRGAAKNTSFAIAYGAGLNKVALTLNIPHKDAKPGFERYKERFPKVAGFTRQMSEEVRQFGYITDAFGVKKYVPKTMAHVGANWRIQRDAAVILKLAENKVDAYSMEKWDYAIRIQMPVHDELVLAYPRRMLPVLHPVCKEIGHIMTNVPEIRVPLEVEWKKSITTWAAAKEFTVV